MDVTDIQILGRGGTFICRFFYVFACLRVCPRQNLVHEIPLGNSGATYLGNVTDTVQSVYTATILAQVSTLQLVACRALLHCIAPRPFTRYVFVAEL